MSHPYDRILQTIRRSDRDVRFAVRCGSRVYGTHQPTSDEDFFVVLEDRAAKQDLAWGNRINVVVHGRDAFDEALKEQSVFALECLFAPPEHRFKESQPPVVAKVDTRRLFESAKGRSDSDYTKAKKRYEEEPAASLKKVFHSLRVVTFAIEIADHGRISDYAAANRWWTELAASLTIPWGEIDDRFGAIRNELLAGLETRVNATAKRRR